MIVVANTYILNKFRQISIFKLNLGESLIDQKREQIDIKDPFIMKYFNMTGKQILSYGIIGTLKFYQDFTLSQKEFYIFNSETVYNLIFGEEDEKIPIDKYLADIVKEINDTEGIQKEKIDEKSDQKINKALPKEQYIQEMIKKRNS